MAVSRIAAGDRGRAASSVADAHPADGADRSLHCLCARALSSAFMVAASFHLSLAFMPVPPLLLLQADVEAEEAAAGGLGSSSADSDSMPAANMELAAALWKGIFREDDAANSEGVLMLADYTRRELVSVLTQPKEDVYRGWISWGPCVGESPAQRTERQRRMLEGEWREALDLKGQVYFYHTASQERRWEPPAEGLYDRRRFALTRFLEARSGGDAAALLDAGRKGASAKLEASGSGSGGSKDGQTTAAGGATGAAAGRSAPAAGSATGAAP